MPSDTDGGRYWRVNYRHLWQARYAGVRRRSRHRPCRSPRAAGRSPEGYGARRRSGGADSTGKDLVGRRRVQRLQAAADEWLVKIEREGHTPSP